MWESRALKSRQNTTGVKFFLHNPERLFLLVVYETPHLLTIRRENKFSSTHITSIFI